MKRQILVAILSMAMMMTTATAFGATSRPIKAMSVKTAIAAACVDAAKEKTGLIVYKEQEDDDNKEGRESGTMISGAVSRSEFEKICSELNKTPEEKAVLLMHFDENMEIQKKYNEILEQQLLNENQQDSESMNDAIAFLESQEVDLFDDAMVQKAVDLGYLKQAAYCYEAVVEKREEDTE